DYDYLERGGRLHHLTALLGKTIHLVPVLQLSEDGTHLTRFAIKRRYAKAVHEIIDRLKKENVGSKHRLYISHALDPQLANEAYDLLKEAFPETEIIIYKLTPGFTTQGGPGCIAIQSICME
ncbi:MAG: DegV family protein, partial [Lachnospiraceae bacterium]|nr:DegV family protein [Lachnospiraceae bacterium]